MQPGRGTVDSEDGTGIDGGSADTTGCARIDGVGSATTAGTARRACPEAAVGDCAG